MWHTCACRDLADKIINIHCVDAERVNITLKKILNNNIIIIFKFINADRYLKNNIKKRNVLILTAKFISNVQFYLDVQRKLENLSTNNDKSHG